MPHLLSCSRGHRWHAAVPSGGGSHVRCPVCGANHLLGPTAAPADAQTMGATLELPAAPTEPEAIGATLEQPAAPTEPEAIGATLEQPAPGRKTKVPDAFEDTMVPSIECAPPPAADARLPPPLSAEPDQTLPPQPGAAIPEQTILQADLRTRLPQPLSAEPDQTLPPSASAEVHDRTILQAGPSITLPPPLSPESDQTLPAASAEMDDKTLQPAGPGATVAQADISRSRALSAQVRKPSAACVPEPGADGTLAFEADASRSKALSLGPAPLPSTLQRDDATAADSGPQGTMDFVAGGASSGASGTAALAPTNDGTAMYLRADPAHNGPQATVAHARENQANTGGPKRRADLSSGQTQTDESPALPGGPTIPGYKILKVLGRGAMGVVYQARQVGLNRLVALKMILSGDHAGARDLARFRVEAEAVAKLQHPHIVQVYEINSADGKPYFCLEFVDGGPLDKKLAGAPQPFREAAELVRHLADAMGYAHERHIIHRDLKPANILLTQDGAPKVTDFGLAKKMDEESAHTQSGTIMGTPSYMSPEQAQGRTREVGPAADTYSLGAILYEMLVGRPPFKGETILETLEQVSTQEPVPPSRLRPKMPHDLETICLKCLQKERGKRYASAAALAEDLRRFVNGEPILARPTPSYERAWKWVRRHPVPAALAAVSALFVLCLVVGGVAFGVYQRGEAREQARLRGVAEGEHQAAEHNFQRAEENYGRARSAVDQMLTEVGQERLAREPRMEKLRRELLNRALDFYKQFLAEKGADPGVRRETGRAHLRMGDIQEMLGEHAAAEESYIQARTFFTDLRTEFPDDAGYRRDLAVCLNNLGQVLKDAGRTPEAEQAQREALDLLQKLVEESGQEEDRRQLSVVTGDLGVLLLGWGRYAEAETVLRQSLQLREQLAAASAAQAVRLELARGHNNLGLLLAAVGRADEADQECRKALDACRWLTTEYPNVPEYRQELAVSYNHLGNLWRDTRPKEAEKDYRESLKLRQTLAADFPTVPAYRQEQAASYHSLGFVLQAAGRQDDADEAYDQALAIEKNLVADYPKVPDYPYGLAGSYYNRGISLQTTNRLPEAEVLYVKALGLLEPLVAAHADAPAYQRELADTLQNLGVLYQTTNRPDQAAKSLRRSLDLRQKLADSYPRAPLYQQDLAETQLGLGASWQLSGKPPDAEACYTAAVARFTELADRYPEIPDYRHLLAGASNNLGVLLHAANRLPEAEKALNKTVALLTALQQEQPAVPSYREELGRGLNELGMVLASSGRAAEAEKAWGRLLPLQEQLAADFPKNPVYREELAKYHGNLGVLYVGGGRLNQAEQSCRRSIALLEELEKADPAAAVYWQDLISPYTNLVTLLTALGAPSDEPERCWRRLADLKRKLADAYPAVAPFQSGLGATLDQLARVERGRQKPAEARDALQEAVRRQQAAVKLDPQNAALRQALCSYYLALAQTLLDLGDHAGAADAVAQLVQSAPPDWSDQHLAAACLAHAAGLAATDDKLSATQREDLAQKYGGQAVDLLRQGAAKGFKDADFLGKTKDFDPLRPRDDFKKLTAELAQK